MLQIVAKLLQEVCGGSTVDCSVIKGEGKTHSGVAYVSCGSLLDAVGDGAHAEDSRLRGIDNGSKAFNTQGAEIGHGEAGTGELIGADLAGLSLRDQGLGGGGKLIQRKGLRERQSGNQKSSFGIHGNAQIHVLEVSDSEGFWIRQTRRCHSR